jgi:predicted Fe-Mo cluster-binding NifX family protein
MGFEWILLMRIAIPHWQGRVSPVLDTAEHLLLIDVLDHRETSRRDVALGGDSPSLRAMQLAGLEPDVLVCGAVSRPLEMAIRASGIDVRPHICGELDAVLRALLDENLHNPSFLMPGCCGRRGRGQRRRRRGGRCREEQRKGD